MAHVLFISKKFPFLLTPEQGALFIQKNQALWQHRKDFSLYKPQVS